MTISGGVLEELAVGDEACSGVPSTLTVVRRPSVRLKMGSFRVASLLMKGELMEKGSSLWGRNTPQVSSVGGTRASRVKRVSRVPMLVVEPSQLDDAGSAEMREGRSERRRMVREECIFLCSWFGQGVGDVEDRRRFFLIFDERKGERED